MQFVQSRRAISVVPSQPTAFLPTIRDVEVLSALLDVGDTVDQVLNSVPHDRLEQPAIHPELPEIRLLIFGYGCADGKYGYSAIATMRL